MFGTRETFAYVECGSCGGLQIAEIPADLGSHYPDNYYSFSDDDDVVSLKKRIWLLARRAQRIAKDRSVGAVERVLTARFGELYATIIDEMNMSAGSRILDVGCGSGILLRTLRDNGFYSLLGVDPFVPKSKSDGFGLRVLKMELCDLEGSYDLIMLHHVFEHVPDPAETLSQLRRLLAPSGRIMLRFPCVPCAAFDRYGTDWVQLDAPRHLQIYSKTGLMRCAAALGLELINWRCDSGPLQFWGSEQYRRDIPLFDEKSFAKDKSVLSPAEVREFEERAEALNREGIGDQCVAILGHAVAQRSGASMHGSGSRT